jgi:putative transposase
MVPSMSRPANPYDNTSCESFMKTLKREEIYANKYDDLKHLRANIEEFIEQYLQSAAVALGAGLSIPGRIRAKDRIPGRISKRDDGVF